MAFYSYEGVSNDVLDKTHTTSTGETYTLRHNEALKVEMQFLGKGNSSANSQGWERNSAKYFDALYQNHPEMFSKKNVVRIKEGNAPIVDQKMISCNPKWEQYRNQPLVHHHIGGDGEAVALPKNAHKGSGEIHNYEKAAGITDNCKSFSQKCAHQSDSVGKTTSQLHSQLSPNRVKTVNISQTPQNRAVVPSNNQTTKESEKSTKRTDAVHNAATRQKTSSSSRSDLVQKSLASSKSTASTERSNAVKNSTLNNNGNSTLRSPSSNGASHSHSSSSSGASKSSGGGASHGASSSGGQSR